MKQPARFAVATAAALFYGACGGGVGILGDAYERPTGEILTDPVFEVRTHVEAPRLVVGESTTIRCLMLRDGQFVLPSTSVTVEVTPAAGEITGSGHTFTWSGGPPGRYHLACVTEDGELDDPDGVVVDVLVGLPAKWTVSANEGTCFGATDRLEIDTTIEDAFGNVLPISGEVSVVPATGWIGNLNTGFRFIKDGTYHVQVNLPGPYAPGAQLKPVTFTVTVDVTPPVITFTSPTKGATLQQGTNSNMQIAVVGSVSDNATPITSLIVDNQPMPLTKGSLYQSFSTYHSSRWGLSVVSAVAVDGCGNVGYAAVPFHRSPNYYAPATAPSPSARVSEALRAQVSQTLLDDGEPDLDDLVSITQNMLDHYDYNTIVAPGEAVSVGAISTDCSSSAGLHYNVGHWAGRHPNASYRITAAPHVDSMQFNNGAVSFDIGVNNVNIPLYFLVGVVECAGGLPIAVEQLELGAWVGLRSFDLEGIIGVNVSNGKPKASVVSFDPDITGLYLDVDCGSLDWACDEASTFVMGRVEGIVEDLIKDLAEEMIPPLLEEALDDISYTQKITLPTDLGTNLSMKVDLSRLTLCGSSVGLAQPSMCGSHNRFPGSMGVGVNGQIYPSSRGYTIPVSAKGSIQFSGQEPTFSSSQTSFGAAVRTDFINQAFWALWYGGGLDQADLRALVPSIPEGIELSVRANLPPVLMPGTGGHSFHLGLGDLDIDATVDINRFLNETQGGNPVWVNINLNLSLLVGAGISLNRSTNELSLVAGNSPELYFTIYSIDDRTYGPLIGERLGKLLSKTYAELLAGAVRSIDIPEFDMSGTASLPQGTVFKLTRGILGHNEGHVTVSGTVGLAN